MLWLSISYRSYSDNRKGSRNSARRETHKPFAHAYGFIICALIYELKRLS